MDESIGLQVSEYSCANKISTTVKTYFIVRLVEDRKVTEI